MKLQEITQPDNINIVMAEALSNYDTKEEVLTEGIMDIIDNVKDWFTRRRVRNLEFSFLEKGNQYITVVNVDNEYEVAEYTRSSLSEFMVFTDMRGVERYLNEKIDEGYELVNSRREIKRIAGIFTVMVGAGIFAGSTWLYLGPAIAFLYASLSGVIVPAFIATVSGWLVLSAARNSLVDNEEFTHDEIAGRLEHQN